MANLTRKQQQIYDYILAFTSENGYPPSVHAAHDGHLVEMGVLLLGHRADGGVGQGDGPGFALRLDDPIDGTYAEIIGKVAAVVRRY